MKKTICSLLIIIILMNFTLCNFSYAAGQEDGMQSESGLMDPAPINPQTPTDILENGTSDGQTMNSDVAGPTIIGTIFGYLALIIDIIPLQIQVILSYLAYNDVTPVSDYESVWGAVVETVGDFFVTIEKIIFNKVSLFNINYFNSDSDYRVGSGVYELIVDSNESNLAIKQSVSKMYIICRVIALIISLLVLIYIGIRMAISTVASDKAVYKKMLYSWVESVVILMVLIYIMVFIINIGEIFINVFYNMKCSLEGAGEKSFETVITDTLVFAIFNTSGLQLMMYSIMYWVLVFTHLKFLYLYMKRMLLVGFLIMIAPLITITYPIDKAGDGKAQAFGAWLSEFSINVLIQPLHCIIYIVFMFTAGAIAEYAPILGLIFLLSLGTVEKTVKRLFAKEKSASLGALNGFAEKLKKK